ncbi:MAG: DoxX family protein [Chlamydiia bacterium]|nr:DoxX family protein [Chlamydiia bacterium]
MEDKLLKHESKGQSWVLLIGRLCIAFYFIWSGYSKIVGWDTVLEYKESLNIPHLAEILHASVGIELIGGLLIALGIFTRPVAGILIIYMILTTLLFNRFWTFSEQEQFLQTVLFMKQLTIIGCLEILRTAGAGRLKAWS